MGLQPRRPICAGQFCASAGRWRRGDRLDTATLGEIKRIPMDGSVGRTTCTTRSHAPSPEYRRAVKVGQCTSCCVLCMLNFAGRRDQARIPITVLSCKVLSSTTTMAEALSLVDQTENHTVARPVVLRAVRRAWRRHLRASWPTGPIGRTFVAFVQLVDVIHRNRLGKSPASGFNGVSTYKCLDLGWLLRNSDPPPCP